MSQPGMLSAAEIRQLARSQSYEKGETYYERGAVDTIVQRGERLQATVAGSQSRSSEVTIEFNGTGIAATNCSCPYDHGGICKHRVAVLLTAVRAPERITQMQPLSERIAGADQATLADVLVDLVERRPELARQIEVRLDASRATDGAPGDPTVSVDPDAIRAQAEHALPKPGQRGHEDAYAEAERMAEELDELLGRARVALDAGDGNAALDLLGAITEVLVTNSWTGLFPYDVSGLYETIANLGDLFVDAVLTADLDERERHSWAEQLRAWEEDAAFKHFMGEPTLLSAAEAVRDGWDDERIQRAMAGAFQHGEFWDEDSTRYNAGVMDARLRVLDRQDRIHNYLDLSLALGDDTGHATMLVEAGRIEDAVEYGLEHVSTPESAHKLARVLAEAGHPVAASTVAEHGLTVQDRGRARGRKELATWLREHARTAGDDDLALEASRVAFDLGPSLRAYQAAKEIAGDDWETVREDLLEIVRRNQDRDVAGAVDVLLSEALYDEAIDLVEDAGGSSEIASVVEAAGEERPEWAIEACKQQAEPIIENGRHDRYRTAVRWLDRAGTVAAETGRGEEWRVYVEGIRDDHYRKSKLRPMLAELLENR